MKALYFTFILYVFAINVNYDDLAIELNQQSHEWSIHGFWPEFNRTSWPQFCNKTRYYDFTPNTLQGNLLDQMNKYWSSDTDESNWDFWTHEWRKHGTCQPRDPKDYFQNTINLFLEAKQNDWYDCCNDEPSQCLIHINKTTNKWLGYCTGDIPR